MGFKRPEVQILSPRPYETLEIIEVSRVLLYISPAPGEGSGELIAMRKTANPFPVRREARSQDPTQRSQAAGLTASGGGVYRGDSERADAAVICLRQTHRPGRWS